MVTESARMVWDASLPLLSRRMLRQLPLVLLVTALPLESVQVLAFLAQSAWQVFWTLTRLVLAVSAVLWDLGLPIMAGAIDTTLRMQKNPPAGVLQRQSRRMPGGCSLPVWCCLLLLFGGSASAQGLNLEQAQAEYDAAFSRYTELVTTGGSGDAEQARADLLAASERLERARAEAPAVTAERSPDAHFQHGMDLYRGLSGRVDKPAAAREFEHAAEAGHARAQFNLGRMLWLGDGIGRDVGGGVRWMRQAAEAGQANAQFVLAQAYEQGLGVAQDAAAGRAWLERAAAGGEPLALKELGQRLVEGRGVPRDIERGRTLLARASTETPQAPGPARPRAITAEAAGSTAEAIVAALRRLIDAQARSDAAAMQAALATAHLEHNELQMLTTALARTTAGLRLHAVQIEPQAIGVSAGGQWALLRYRYGFDVEAGGQRLPQSGGNLALLRREADAWKVQQIVPDEELTQATLESAGSVPVARRVSDHKRAACAGRGAGLLEPEAVRDAMSRAIAGWRVDEAKLGNDAFYSAFGRIPIVGDTVANSYTTYERIKTLAVELPSDYRAGNLQAVFLDVTLVAWGGVQFVAEYVPLADNATDLVETAIENYRYNSVQRFNLVQLQARLRGLDFADLPKYLFIRPSSREQHDRIGRTVHGLKARDWHGRWPALRALDVLDDELLRHSPRLAFSVGAEWPIARADNESLYEIARAIGASVPYASTPAGEVAYVGLDLTRMVLSDDSTGDPVFGLFQHTGLARPVAYTLSCERGTQELKVRLSDGSTTAPVTVRNLPFSLIQAVHIDGADSLDLAVGESRQSLVVGVTLATAPDGLQVHPPAILKSACVKRRLLGTDVVDAEIDNEWPQARLNLQGHAPGTAVLEFHWPATTGMTAMTLPLMVNIHAAPPAALPAPDLQVPTAAGVELGCGYALRRLPQWEGAPDTTEVTLERAKVSAKVGSCGWDASMTAQVTVVCNPLFGPQDAAEADTKLRQEDAEFNGDSWYAGSEFETVHSGGFSGPLRTTRQHFERGGWSGGYRPDGMGGQAHGYLFSADQRVEIRYSAGGSGCWDDSDKDWLLSQAATAMAEARAVALGTSAASLAKRGAPAGSGGDLTPASVSRSPVPSPADSRHGRTRR